MDLTLFLSGARENHFLIVSSTYTAVSSLQYEGRSCYQNRFFFYLFDSDQKSIMSFVVAALFVVPVDFFQARLALSRQGESIYVVEIDFPATLISDQSFTRRRLIRRCFGPSGFVPSRIKINF